MSDWDFGPEPDKFADYWKKYAAKKSGGASISAPPPRSSWDVFMDSLHDMVSSAGSGLNAVMTRGNEAAREEDLARRWGSDHNQSPETVDKIVKENQLRRAGDINEKRASRALQMEDEQRRRSGGGKVAAKAAEIAGSVVGDLNPTYAIGGLGANALERVVGMGALAGANDMVAQGDEVRHDIREHGDPLQTLATVAGGAALQGAGEVVAKGISKASLARKVYRGAQHPDWQAVNEVIVRDLEGGGTLSHPNVSKKGAMGPQQVMPETAKDPGFGIRPWNGKTQSDLARVGRQYSAAMMDKYDGDVAKVLAAYNWGPGHVDKAIAKYGRHWFSDPHMPGVTRDYVTKGTNILQRKGSTGGPVAPMHPDDMAAAMGDPAAAGHVTDDLQSVLDMGDINDNAPIPHFELTPSPSERLFQMEGDKDDLGGLLAHGRRYAEADPNNPLADFNRRFGAAVTKEGHYFRWEEKKNSDGVWEVFRSAGMFPKETDWTGRATKSKPDNWTDIKDAINARLKNEAVQAGPEGGAEIRDLGQARDAKQYQKTADIVDQLYNKVADLNEHVVENGGAIDHEAAEATRSNVNSELGNFEPGSPEHNKLLAVDDMLKEAIAYSGGKPRLYGPEASDVHFGGEPKTDAANNRFPVYDSPVPGKTLHEYNDEEFLSLGPIHKKQLVDEANDRLFHGPEPMHPPAASSHMPDRRMGRRINPRSDAPPKMAGEHEPDERTLRTEKKKVIDKLGDLLDQSAPIRREAEAAISQERKQRLAAAYAAKKSAPGRAGTIKAMAALKGEMGRPKITPIADQFTPAEIDLMHDGIWNSPMLSGYEPIRASKALDKLLHEGDIPTANDVALLAKAMPQKAKVWRALLEDDSGSLTIEGDISDFKRNVINVAGLTRTLKASFDVSAPMRQGVFLIGSKNFWKALPGMFKAFASKGEFEKIQEEIVERPTYDLMNKAGLQTTHTNQGMIDREEAFISQFAEKIPGVRNSERAYIAFLNKLRADTFDDFVKKGERLDIDFIQDPDYLKSAARYINSATGRGDMGSLAKNGELLANVLFSPKLMKSRIDMLNPVFYATLDPRVRVEAAKHGLVATSAMLSMMGLAVGAGATVEKDPRSSDFGKIKVGNTRFDVTGGFQPYVRFYAQMLMGQQKATKDGEIRNVGETIAPLRKLFPGVDQGAFKPTTRKDLVYRFFENKESPNMGEVTRLLQGADAVGNPLGTNHNPIADGMSAATGMQSRVGNEAVEMFTPLILSDTYQAYRDLGPAGVFAAIPSAVGVGVQVYTPKAEKPKALSGSDWDFDKPSTTSSKEWDF